MKLVVDSKIPFMKGFAESLGEVTYLPGAEITAHDVRDADALIVRTRTRCDRKLLEGSRVRFIATATIGYDHIDTHYLAEAGIGWTNCPGCNAKSVAQYIESALLLLKAHGCWNAGGALLPAGARLEKSMSTETNREVFGKLTLGIVGAGHVGTQVLHAAVRLGFGEVLLCDPPRSEREGQDKFVTLAEIARRCDVITFHTPLTYSPEPHATFHLASADFFDGLCRKPVLINSGRGEVVDTQALKQALGNGKLKTAIIDTWENEPDIDRELLGQVFLGTPHIAGYSADGKANGTRMSLQAVARHFGLDDSLYNEVSAPEIADDFVYYPEGSGHLFAEELRLYDPTLDWACLKKLPENFEKWRSDYPLRREKV